MAAGAGYSYRPPADQHCPAMESPQHAGAAHSATSQNPQGSRLEHDDGTHARPGGTAIGVASPTPKLALLGRGRRKPLLTQKPSDMPERRIKKQDTYPIDSIPGLMPATDYLNDSFSC